MFIGRDYWSHSKYGSCGCNQIIPPRDFIDIASNLREFQLPSKTFVVGSPFVDEFVVSANANEKVVGVEIGKTWTK